MDKTISGLAGYGLVYIRLGQIWSWIWSCPYPARPDMVRPYPAKLSQLAGGAEKNTFFGGFLPVFRPVFCFFTGHLYVQSLFCKKKSVHLTCSGRRSAHYKVPPRIGGCHFLLCQHTNTKDIAGQSANAVFVYLCICVFVFLYLRF